MTSKIFWDGGAVREQSPAETLVFVDFSAAMALGAANPPQRRRQRSYKRFTVVMTDQNPIKLQLFLPPSSESMGNHDSDIVDADGVG
jgi:hypothetical protein